MKALMFDLDGTLMDARRRGVESMHDTLKHFGVVVPAARVKKLRTRLPSYFEVLQNLGLEITDEVAGYLTSAFVQRYQMSVVRKGVKPALEVLSKKYTLVCVTSRETAEEVIEELTFHKLARFFKNIVTRNVAAKHFGLASIPLFPFYEQRRKLYQCALALSRCSSSDAAAIGDERRELEPAKELGMVTIGIPMRRERRSELQEASDFLISNMAQLPNVLLELDEAHQATESELPNATRTL
jgi:phosphoglycolate phosphatase-like HAD superfamily hydrolase